MRIKNWLYRQRNDNGYIRKVSWNLKGFSNPSITASQNGKTVTMMDVRVNYGTSEIEFEIDETQFDCSKTVFFEVSFYHEGFKRYYKYTWNQKLE